MPLPRVLFVTTGLDTGGAEKMLVKLLEQLHAREIEAAAVSLRSPGPVSEEIAALGVPVWHLGLERPWRIGAATAQLARIARRFRPDVLQGWMYHGNLAAGFVQGLAARRAALVFGIRQSLDAIAREKRATRLVIRAGARLSHRAAAVAYNSETARDQHEAFGYRSQRSTVIDNGFDTAGFRPDPAACRNVRAELGLVADTPLIGLIARHHPMKGHDVFLQAAAIVAAEQPSVHFLLAGSGVTRGNPAFGHWTRRPRLSGRVHLLGERPDIPRLTAALDIATSSSCWGEAFPNALGEAMSCAVPVAATDVGDVRRIVGEAGIIVPAGDPGALARAWAALLADSARRASMGRAGRRRVEQRFSIESVAQRYARLYRDVAAGREGR